MNFSIPSLRGRIGLVATTLACLVAARSLTATPVTFSYLGDMTPAQGVYGNWFTTVGPGHPTGSYFVGTQWSSNGNYLTMTTEHPDDFPGATSKGIWFGLTSPFGGYGDPSTLNFSDTLAGNQVEARMALAPNSSEWSLYWADASGRGAQFYLFNNGFNYYTVAGNGNVVTNFVARNDMTSFHTYTSHIQNGQVSYYFDGSLLGTSAAYNTAGNYLFVGDTSAGSVSGYGSLLIDQMDITVDAGPDPIVATVPDTTSSLMLAAVACIGLMLFHRGLSARGRQMAFLPVSRAARAQRRE